MAPEGWLERQSGWGGFVLYQRPLTFARIPFNQRKKFKGRRKTSAVNDKYLRY